MKIKVDVSYTIHCDMDDCDLGYAYLNCPHCDAYIEDYDELWWGQHLPNNNLAKVSCDKCNVLTILRKVDYGEYETYRPDGK